MPTCFRATSVSTPAFRSIAPRLLVQRVCGTGIEAISQAADAISLKKIQLGLCVGAESMSRNPIAAYTHRGGFRLGQVEFKDFLWEALLDPAPGITMGQTAENTARKYKITREEVDRFAELSFARALAAQKSCFLSGEITPLDHRNIRTRRLQPSRHPPPQQNRKPRHRHAHPSLVLRSPLQNSPRLRRRTNRRQQFRHRGRRRRGPGRLRRIRKIAQHPAARARSPPSPRSACRPEIMSIAPAPAIRKLLDGVGLATRRHRPLRNQRSLRRANHRRRTRARSRSQQAQRQRRRHRHRPSPRGHRHTPSRHGLARTPPLESALRHRVSLHRRRAGNRSATRNPALKNRATLQIHLTDVFHPRARRRPSPHQSDVKWSNSNQQSQSKVSRR